MPPLAPLRTKAHEDGSEKEKENGAAKEAAEGAEDEGGEGEFSTPTGSPAGTPKAPSASQWEQKGGAQGEAGRAPGADTQAVISEGDAAPDSNKVSSVWKHHPLLESCSHLLFPRQGSTTLPSLCSLSLERDGKLHPIEMLWWHTPRTPNLGGASSTAWQHHIQLK